MASLMLNSSGRYFLLFGLLLTIIQNVIGPRNAKSKVIEIEMKEFPKNSENNEQVYKSKKLIV